MGKTSSCLFGCLIGASGMLVLFVILPLLLLAALLSPNSSDLEKPALLPRPGAASQLRYGEDECPAFRELWSYGASIKEADAKVVRIPLRGTIMLDEEAWYSAPGSAVEALASIHRATLDDSVAGILLEVDSPGGGVTSSDILWNALRDFKAASSNRVVFVHMGDLCASGGYYVSMAADEIMALPTTMTGSIGVILSSYNVKEFAKKLGISDVTIASGKNKAMLSPFQDLTPEQRQLLQSMIDSMHGRFVDIVAEGRDLPREKVAELADGRIYLASEAQRIGLIDEIGYFKDACERMERLLGVDAICFVRYKREETFQDLFRNSGLPGLSGLFHGIRGASTAKFLFMSGK